MFASRVIVKQMKYIEKFEDALCNNEPVVRCSAYIYIKENHSLGSNNRTLFLNVLRPLQKIESSRSKRRNSQ